MMPAAPQSPKRLAALACSVLALVLGPFCLLWYWARSVSNPEELYSFLGVAFVALASGVASLALTRNRWRWLLLVLLLPLSLALCERLWEWWSWSHHRGILPYFLFLLPPTLVAFGLWAFTRWLTAPWPTPAARCSPWNLLRAALQALPFALVFAPVWVSREDYGFLLPASSFLFIPGFGGIFGASSPHVRAILLAVASLALVWLLLTLFFLPGRPASRRQER